MLSSTYSWSGQFGRLWIHKNYEVDRNRRQFINIYTCDGSDFQKAAIRIFHGADDSSNIVLPVLQ